VIGCEDRLRSDLDCVGWGVKLYPNSQLKPIKASPFIKNPLPKNTECYKISATLMQIHPRIFLEFDATFSGTL